MKVVIVSINPFDMEYPNLGLAYLISSICHNHEVQLIDLSWHSKDYLKYIEEKLTDKPDIVGFSVNSFALQDALYIGSCIKRIYPDTAFIFGGVHPTLMPEETLKYPLVDAVCIGEGEKAFNEYLDCLENGREPMVDGIWYKDARGKIIRNKLRPFEENLDDIPFPDWDYWDIERYLNDSAYFIGSIPVLASRGCPYGCTYCSVPAIRNRIKGNAHRVRSPQNVIEEIKVNIKKYWGKGFRTLYIWDDTFGLDNGFLREFCSLYIKEGLNEMLPWICQTRCDLITEEWAREVKRAGCFLVSFGIESGDDYIRNQIYKKNISRSQIMKAVRRLKDNGIEYTANFVIGCLEETKESINNTLKLLKEIDPAVAVFSFYQPLPGTELGERIRRQKGIKIEERTLAKYSNNPIVKPEKLTTKQLNRIKFKSQKMVLYMILKKGFKQKGLMFFLDIFSYILTILRTINLKGSRSFSNSFSRLTQKALRKYLAEIKNINPLF